MYEGPAVAFKPQARRDHDPALLPSYVLTKFCKLVQRTPEKALPVF